MTQIGVGIDLGTSNCRVQIARSVPGGRRLDGINVAAAIGGGAVPVSLQYRGNELIAFGRFASGAMQEGAELIESWKPSIGQHPDDVQGSAGDPGFLRCRTPDCPGAQFAYPPAAKTCMYCQAPLERADLRVFDFSRREALKYSEDLLSRIWKQVLHATPTIVRNADAVVCIGHPVHWGERTRDEYAEVLARAVAPYKVELIPEPAAALYHCADLGELQLPAKVAVVDFGAGTTDFCFTDVDSDGTRLRLTNTTYYGEDYGGSNFDSRLMQNAMNSAMKDTGDASGPTLTAEQQREWVNVTKRWKEQFSFSLDQPEPPPVVERFALPDGQLSKPLLLNTQIFETVCGDLIKRFRSALDTALKKCEVAPEEIDLVLTTGGGARWYFVQEHLQKVFSPERVFRDPQPELSIAMGLALAPLLGAIEFPPTPPPPPPEPPPVVRATVERVGYLIDLDFPSEPPYRLDAPRFQFGSQYGYGNHVVLKDPNRVISRKQAVIYHHANGTYELEVLLRTNPTSVNGRVVLDRAPLDNGAKVVFANRNFRFELREEGRTRG